MTAMEAKHISVSVLSAKIQYGYIRMQTENGTIAPTVEQGWTERSKRMNKDDFEEGEYIVYVNGEKHELGRIKTLREDGAFVAYHEGETGAKTPYDTMHKLINNYVIKKTSLGGEYFKEQENE